MLRTWWCLLCLVGAVFGVRNVAVSKCCNFDEILTRDSNNSFKCVRTEQISWNLKVFSFMRKSYLPSDQVPPSNWKMQENSKPICANPRLISANLANYLAFQNGSLYIVEYNQVLHPKKFCVDYKSVLVCLGDDDHPEAVSLARIKKCCGLNAIFSQTNRSCIRFVSKSYTIDVGPNATLGQGFPNCDHQEVVFNGKLQDATILDNGSLSFKKTIVPAANYCLEHVLEDAGKFRTF